MNYAHLHLLVNHVPVLGSVFSLLLLAWAVLRRNEALMKTAVGAFVLVGLAAVAVYFTGEPAAHAIRNIPDYSKDITESHEEAALVATIATGVLGAVAAIVLRVSRGRPVSRRAAMLVLAGGIIVSGLMAWAAFLGGRVRHTEIRPGASVGVRPTPTAPAHRRLST